MIVFDTLEKGQVLGTHTVKVNRADLVRYAGASGDFNPIHWNERFAKEVELPSVIAHGMFTMGAVIDLVSTWVGNPGAVIDYQTRFTKPVVVEDPEGTNPSDFEGTTIEVEGKIGALDAEARTARVDLTVSANGTKVLLKCQAVVQL
ncbi:MaoC family dehydratase [Glutamicibacter protophormiae]|uniref:Hydroxyacyl-ACP dehydratase HTD2-like protein with hotdog domain n=1 Tax=Glutamicibacter protophormiae TaxID=37930 RepID=A0ABS4XV88_GLUPR|nr:MaoC family dehydratase [Glutamicibacter protophormiae]MBP2400416.1 hydroxyacyl-ACP dehydratase HTD2-like protein with hotdog domain [Glutamicibacter protophormiae]QRQ77699.1 MaoC family dehydratase [Glutamicibacter protophormiae]WPR63706.1 MaoC family dehydratase [Glutamicibacter protophormiae]WPR67201.1 MaoC family dehydratase [Glutamicibacter protophormiae]GGL94221.1 MaoC family dehydratase [Glutamicibacter protophormiae]